MPIYAYVGGTGPTLDLDFVAQTYQRGNTPVTYTYLAWREVQAVYAYRNGAWVQTVGSWAGRGGTYQPLMAGINYLSLAIAILKAYTDPASAEGVLFNRIYNGRKVGDVNNDTLITLSDSLDALKFYNGTAINPVSEAYLRNELLPIFQYYAPDYNAYLYS